MLRSIFAFFTFAFLLITNTLGQNYIPSETKAAIQELTTNQHQGTVSFIAKINIRFDVDLLKSRGITVGSVIGDIATLRINSAQLQEVCDLPGIDYLQIAQKTNPNLSRAIPDLRADSVYDGYLLKHGYSGKNVIIGITDWGFDYTHPMFYDSAMEHTRILAAWDQFKTSGPPPDGYDYGTEYEGETALLNAQSDTVNIYDYATHGSHVAGIAGGGGAGTEYRGVAYNANFLLATFLVDDAAVLDAFAWLKKKAEKYDKRLVINMSWGLHYIGTLDGNSLLSQAIDAYSAQGVVFVTSGGNNGDVKDHIEKEFNGDTIQSLVEFFPYSAHPKMWGQSISIWGEKNQSFGFGFTVYNSTKNLLFESTLFLSKNQSAYVDTFCIIDSDTIFYNLSVDKSHPLNNRPHMRFRVKNTHSKLRIGIKTFADSGTVHLWNIVELSNGVGNWGMPFSSFLTGWTEGDNLYAIDEPACAKSAITVAAHSSEIKLSNGTVVGGAIASFSSIGPTLDGRIKPDISAPGVNVASSISSFTTNDYTLLTSVNFNGKDYPFARFSGTSMSSPATAGVVALMLEANPGLFPIEIKEILQQTARLDKNTGVIPLGGNTIWGAGKVNAYAAVLEAEKRIPNAPDPIREPTFKLFPNPAASILYFSGINNVRYEAEIYSMDGKLLLTGKIGNAMGLDISNISNGMYVVRIYNNVVQNLVFFKTP